MAGSASAVFYRAPGDAYPTIVRGDGCYLWDDSGQRLLDLSSGISATASIGQGRSEIAAAYAEQVSRLVFVHSSSVTNEPQEELAHRYAQLAPEGIDRVMFTSGGSEANELSLRIARQYHLARDDTERWKVLALAPSYHGATIGALSMTGRWDTNRDYDPYLFPVRHVPAAVSYRGSWQDADDATLAAGASQAIADAIEAEGPATIAALIVEPIAMSAGTAVPPAAYWQRVRQLCDDAGILLIADEVVTGAGRTGTFLAMEHFDVVADISNLGKGISGGYAPLGATLVHRDIVETIGTSSRQMSAVHTYSGAPLSCAVGLAVLDVIERESLFDNAAARGATVERLFAELLHDVKWVGQTRGLGLLHGIEYVSDRSTRSPFPASVKLSSTLAAEMWQRGFLLRTLHHQSALVTDCTNFAPPLTVTDAQLSTGVEALRDALFTLGPTWEQASAEADA